MQTLELLEDPGELVGVVSEPRAKPVRGALTK